MSESRELPTAVDQAALEAMSTAHHVRAVRPVGARDVGGHRVKVYALEAPGRTVTDECAGAALRIADAHLELGAFRGSLGLAVLIVHAGGDGDYVLVHSWTEGHMSDLAVFSGPAGQPEKLRPGRTGLAPCVWEAAILSHERDAFVAHVLDGEGPFADRLAHWSADVLTGDVR